MRYLRLLAIFYKNCLLTDLEYRVNFLTNVFMSAFWIFFALVSLGVFFQHRSRIGDWSYPEALLVTGLFVLFNGVIEAWLRPNISRVVEAIRLGTFDFVLTKPVDSQFLSSLRYVVVWKLTDVALGVGIVLYAFGRLEVSLSLATLALFLGLLMAAAVIVYSLWLLMVTTAFWFVRIDNITELFMAVYEAGRFPVTVYRGWARGLLTFVVPIAFVTTFPAAAVLHRLEGGYVVLSALMAVVFFAVSSFFWRYAVTHYSSASS
jgi:ABC-2 type transport system permease protein